MTENSHWNLDTLIAAAVPFFFLGIFLEIIYSKRKKLNLYRTNDTIANLSLGVVQQLTSIYSKLFPIFLFKLVEHHVQFFKLPENFLGYSIAFVLVDFVYYWFHRKAHEVNLFWASHVAHHSSEEYNLSVALRQSSVQMFFSTFFYLPLVFVGVTWEMFGICYGLNLIYQFWIHTETIKNFGPLDAIFNSTSHHRVHHGRNPKYLDKNHAGVFIIWDRLFGTFKEEEERPTYGITTPLKTFNPITANVHHFGNLYQDVKRTRNASDALRVLFKKPGWRPDYLGGPLLAPEIDAANSVKFNPPVQKPTFILCLIGFVILTGAGVVIQNKYSLIPAPVLGVLILTELVFLGIIGASLAGWKLKN